MKIATIFVGRVKSYDKTFRSITENVFAGHDVDTFLAHNAANTYDLAPFLSTYDVKAYRNNTIKVPSFFITSHINALSNNKYNPWSMFYNLHDGYKLVEEYAARNRIKYDLVVYMRADMHFNSRVEFASNLAADCIYIPNLPDHRGVTDQLAYGSPAAMKKYCSLFTLIDTYWKLITDYCNPEMLLQFHLNHLKMNVVRFDLSAELDGERTSA